MSFFPSVPMGKKTPYYKYKEREKHKQQEEDDESVKVYRDFVESFEVKEGESATEFVRGETIVHGQDLVEERGKGQTITFRTDKTTSSRSKPSAPAFLPPSTEKHRDSSQVTSKLPSPKDHAALPKGLSRRRGDKQKPKHIDIMLETIKREQEAREHRSRPRRSGFDTMSDKALDASLSGSMPDGDNTTTNLYVGNLAPDLNEEILKREFGRFGPVASVKIMWPRDEDQVKRGSNVGFVAFMSRESAAKCIEKLNGEKLHGLELRIGWGKSVPLPNAPTARHSHGTTSSTAAPTDQALVTTQEEVEKEIEVTIPDDLHVRYVIDTMASFVVKDGPKFEQLVRQREAANPAFGFLIEDGSPTNIYYRWKLFTLVQGDSMRRWRLDPFYMVDGGSSWKPPNMCMGDGSQLTAAQRGEGIAKRNLLSEIERRKFEDMLQNLQPNKSSVCEAMVFALNNAEAAEEVVDILVESLCKETPLTLRIARLFVVSDILHNSSASVRNASQYRTRLGDRLPDVFENLQAVHATLHDKKDMQESVKRYVLRVLRVWRNWFIFSNDYLNGLQSTFLATLRSKAQLTEQLKIVEKMSAEEIERRCKFNGLSLRGGIEQQRLRCARLDAYLQGTPSSQHIAQKKEKTTKAKRQQHLYPLKRDTAKHKSAEKKTSSWVSIVQEQEKKPAVPISQWIQEKHKQLPTTVQEKKEKSTELKAATKKGPKNEDIDMFEADEGDDNASDINTAATTGEREQKRQRTEKE